MFTRLTLRCRYSQFAHIRRSYTILSDSRRALASSSSAKLLASDKVTPSDIADEKRELARIDKTGESLKNDLLVQVGYLPLTMHWCVSWSPDRRVRREADALVARRRSLPNGLLPDQVWVGVFGTLAAACGLRGVWRATA